MATVVVEQVISEYELNASKYVAGSKQVQAASRDAAKAADGASTKSGGLFDRVGASLSKAIGPMNVAKGLLAGIGTAVAGSLGLLGAELKGGWESAKLAASFDSLVASLEAIEGSAEKARRSMAKLKDIAKLPGIGFEEAVKGYSGLRRADLSKEFSLRAVNAVGKANALSGGSVEQFGRLMLALEQTANKPFLQGEELMQMRDAGVNPGKGLRAAFGTEDTEELKKRGITAKQALEAIVASFEKMPVKAGGAQNSLDNLADAFKFAMISMGQAVNKSLMPEIDNLSGAIDDFTRQGGFKASGENIAQTFSAMTGEGLSFRDVLVKVGAGVMTMNSYFVAFYERIKQIVGLLAPIIGFGSALGEAKGAEGKNVAETFKMNETILRNQLALGEKQSKKQEAKDKKADEQDRRMKGTSIQPTNPIAEIAKNTKDTAENTKKMNDVNDRILGGGILGGRGLSKSEMDQAGAFRRPGGGSRNPHIHSALMNLGRVIDMAMSGTTTKAFAQQTSRREV